MEDPDINNAARETAEDELVNGAFQHLLDCYLASRHRKKVDIITKAFKLPSGRMMQIFANYKEIKGKRSPASRISCTRSPSHK